MARSRSRRTDPGRTVLRKVHRGIEKGWPPGLTVLSGEDLYHLDTAYRALLDHLVPDDSTEFALTVFGEGRIDAADLVAAARSIAMFAPSRVVVLRDVGILEGDPQPIAAYAKDPPPSSYLIVRAPKLDLRRPLHKVLAGSGRFLEFASVPGPEDLREVRELASQRGLNLGRDVAGFLLEACGGDLYRVCSEMEKLDVWLGEQKTREVSVAVAREVVSHGGVLSGWEVANAILERDERAALAAVRRLVDAGDEPIRMIGGLAWRVRSLIQGKAMLERGVSPRDVVQAARAWSYSDEYIAALSRYSLHELMAFPARLLAADRSLKSRSLDSISVLESLVRGLVRPQTATASTAVRGSGGTHR